MDVLKGETDLHKPVEYLSFSKVLLLIQLPLDMELKISNYASLYILEKGGVAARSTYLHSIP